MPVTAVMVIFAGHIKSVSLKPLLTALTLTKIDGETAQLGASPEPGARSPEPGAESPRRRSTSAQRRPARSIWLLWNILVIVMTSASGGNDDVEAQLLTLE